MEEMFEVKDDCLKITMPEEMDHHKAEQIREGADEYLLLGKVQHVVFDFSRTRFMDSSGIGMVMGRYRKMSYLGGQTYVTGIGESVDRIFSMSGLYRIIPKYQERMEQR